MDDILYVKITNERRKELQIVTEVLQREGKRYVRKSPLRKEGEARIRKIYENGKLLEQKYADHPDVRICKCEMQGASVVFEYVEGVRFDQYFSEICASSDKQKIIEALNQYYQWILPMANMEEFEKTPEFMEVFGDIDIDTDTLSGTNMDADMIFSNMILNNGCHVIDYEWVFPFPIPLAYVFCKAMFTSKAFSVLDKGIQEEIYEHFDLDNASRNKYHTMEENFQKYVKGDIITFGSLARKFQIKCIHIDGIDWDRQGYVVKCFGRRGEEAREIYSGMIQNGKISLEFAVDREDYERVEVFSAPDCSAIYIEKILGYKNGEEIPVTYHTTADYEEEGVGYYSQNMPVFIIENDGYEKIVCQYEIRVWNNEIIGRVLNRMNRMQNEINSIKNSRTWKIMSRIRGWK